MMIGNFKLFLTLTESLYYIRLSYLIFFYTSEASHRQPKHRLSMGLYLGLFYQLVDIQVCNII